MCNTVIKYDGSKYTADSSHIYKSKETNEKPKSIFMPFFGVAVAQGQAGSCKVHGLLPFSSRCACLCVFWARCWTSTCPPSFGGWVCLTRCSGIERNARMNVCVWLGEWGPLPLTQESELNKLHVTAHRVTGLKYCRSKSHFLSLHIILSQS